MFLFRLHKLANHLLPLRTGCLLLALTGILSSVFALLSAQDQSSPLLRIAILVTLWSLLLFAFIQLFKKIPAPVLPKDPFVDRLRGHVKLGLYRLLALGVAALGLTLVSMSLKLLLH